MTQELAHKATDHQPAGPAPVARETSGAFETALPPAGLPSFLTRSSLDRRGSGRLVAASFHKLQQTSGNGTAQRLVQPAPHGGGVLRRQGRDMETPRSDQPIAGIQRDDPPGVAPAAASAPAPAAASPAVSAAELTAWLAPRQTAPDLRQVRLDVTAVTDGGSYALPQHPVTVDAQMRNQLQEAIRRRLMDRIAEVRAPLKVTLDATHDAPGRRGVQDQMRSAARPFLDELRDPAQAQARFDHPSADVRNEVLAALALDGEGHAEEELADQQAHGEAGPRDRARRVAGLPEGAWCGAFTYAQQREAGLSPEARVAMQETGPNRGIDAFLDYENHQRVVWTGAMWKLIRDYHQERGSLRKLVRLPETPTPVTPGGVYAPQGLDIQPGDIVLIDNARGRFGDHITECRSYDASTGQLETIAGNEGGGAGRVAASAHPRNLNENPQTQIVADGVQKPSRVYAYGRFSIADYEIHTYLPRMPSDPSESPEAMAARHASGGAVTR